jgi:hypothetical protein
MLLLSLPLQAPGVLEARLLAQHALLAQQHQQTQQPHYSATAQSACLAGGVQLNRPMLCLATAQRCAHPASMAPMHPVAQELVWHAQAGKCCVRLAQQKCARVAEPFVAGSTVMRSIQPVGHVLA